MSKFCRNCGAPLQDAQKFCPKCGTPVAEDNVSDQTAPLPRVTPEPTTQMPPAGGYQQQPTYSAPPQQPYGYQPPQPQPSGGIQQNKIIIGLLIVLIVVLAGGIGYFAHSSSQTPAKAPASSTSASSSSSSSTAQPAATQPATPPPAPSGSDLGNFVGEKDACDSAISSLANGINGYLSSHGSFRGNTYYSGQASALCERIQSNIQSLRNTPAADEGKKNALINLFQIEYRRASGLYNGITSSQQGGSYQPGFADGTKAAYEFDTANSNFKAAY